MGFIMTYIIVQYCKLPYHTNIAVAWRNVVPKYNLNLQNICPQTHIYGWMLSDQYWTISLSAGVYIVGFCGH